MRYLEKKIFIFLCLSSCVFAMQVTTEDLLKLPVFQIRQALSPRAGEVDRGAADFVIGLKLLEGVGLPRQDVPMAIKQFGKAIEKGNTDSFFSLAQIYKRGIGVPKDDRKAFDFMKKAADAGHLDALYSLGIMLLDNFLGEGNFSEGIRYISQAASQNYGPALSTLGMFLRDGIDHFGKKIEPDYAKAFEFFKKAAELKSFNGMYNLAQFYKSGLAGEKNPAKAKKLFDTILASEDEDSYLYKALMYENGAGVDKDLNKAKEYYEILVKYHAGNIAVVGLERINEKLLRKTEKKREAEKYVEELLKKGKKNKAKKKSKKKIEAEVSSESESESEEEPAPAIEQKIMATTIVFTEDSAKEALNDALSYEDSSVITSMDTRRGTITMRNPYDDSIVMVHVDPARKPITGKAIKSLKKFTYDERVSKWFGPEEELLPKYSEQEIARHRFAQRVDEIIQLYGDKAVFIKNDGTIEKNKILVGTITTKNGQKLQGTFEFSYYKNQSEKNILYHRFLHPNSRTVVA